jgi:ryanodine receptor 2
MKTEHNTYNPQPVDTSHVELSEELLELAELMAENVHDVWAKTRMEQGWTYGPERDDANKKHPCLIPYDQLPEEEKVSDRNTSIETLKFIIEKGFEIVKVKR